MPYEADSVSWVTLLESRDRLISQLLQDVPSAWPGLIGDFLGAVRIVPAQLPPGALVLLLADLARELDRLAVRESSTQRSELFATFGLASASELPADVLCARFEEAVHRWCNRLEPDTVIPEVHAHRVAEYIDRHFAEPITLEQLSKLSGCCSRYLSRAFRSSMQMSIREYLHAARVDQAAARLRQGDKVESVLATVGWRGRRNFFRHFKNRIGTTPAQYRDSWTAAPPDCHPSHRSPRLPQSIRSQASSNCQTI